MAATLMAEEFNPRERRRLVGYCTDDIVLE